MEMCPVDIGGSHIEALAAGQTALEGFVFGKKLSSLGADAVPRHRSTAGRKVNRRPAKLGSSSDRLSSTLNTIMTRSSLVDRNIHPFDSCHPQTGCTQY